MPFNRADITPGFVRRGQPVRVKVMPYAFQKYGVLEGQVINLSADAHDEKPSESMDHQAAFKAIIEFQRQSLGTELPLFASMQVTAEIIHGKSTVAEYLLSPMQQIMDEAARER
jgi:hemolysin D